MRLFSTAALSLALVAGAGLVMPQAALAQSKKEKEAQQGPQITPSKNFLKPAKAVQDLIAAKDFAGALAKLAEAEAVASTADDKYFIGNFYLNVGLGQQDLAMQLKGVEGMLSSGKVAAADLARIELAAGGLASQLKDNERARTHYAAAQAAGASPSETGALIAETYFTQAYAQVENNAFTPAGRAQALAGLPYLRKAIDAQLAAGTPPPAGWYERGLRTAIVAQAPDAFDWAKLTLGQAATAENWRLALRLLQDGNKDMARGVNIDLMRLMYDAKALQNDYSYSEFVDALWKAGLPGEVKSVIDSGKTAGEINASRFADVYKLAEDAIPRDKGDLGATATSAATQANGRMASRTADAYLAYGDNAKAISLYRLALEKGGVDADEVNTRLGIALLRSGQLDAARQAFGAVSGTNPRRQIADLWTIWASQKGNAAS